MRRFISRPSVCTALSVPQRILQVRRNIFIPLSANTADASHGKECTLYIKGFLAKGEHADHFEDWQRGHKILTKTHNWGSSAYGYFWKSGDLPGSLVPYATLLSGAYQLFTMKKIALTPQALALTAAAEAVVIGGKFYYEFKKAAETAKAHGPSLAAHIEEVTRQYPYVRIVAHSLGCALTLEALRLLPAESRPHEIHFLAPVIDEDEMLHNIAKEHTYLYHCDKDFALQTASTLFYKQKQVVGLAGPKKSWKGLTSIDVSNHFGFFVHMNYRFVLEKLMVNHRTSYTDAASSGAAEVVTAIATESGKSENFDDHAQSGAAENAGEIVWMPESEAAILAKFQNEVQKIAGEKGDKKDEVKIKREEEKVAGVQAIVEDSVQKLGNALKGIQGGLQSVKEMVESRRNILDQAKNLAGAVLENVPLGQKKVKRV